MPRPKTKLQKGSTDVFQYATLSFPSGETMGMASGAAEAPAYLGLIGAAQSFLKRHAGEVEQITKLYAAKHGSNAVAFTNIILTS